MKNPCPGVDLEVGYALIESHHSYLTGYIGGYLFEDGLLKSTNEREARTLWGPKIRLTYDYNAANQRKMLRVFDKAGVEFGMQYDKPRGVNNYIGLKLTVGLNALDQTSPRGFDRHMIELVRRDPDIVLGAAKTITQNRVELPNEQGYMLVPKEGSLVWTEEEKMWLKEFDIPLLDDLISNPDRLREYLREHPEKKEIKLSAIKPHISSR